MPARSDIRTDATDVEKNPSLCATQMLAAQDFHSLVMAVARARRRIRNGKFDAEAFLRETDVSLRKIQKALDEQKTLESFRVKAISGICDADVSEGVLEIDEHARVSKSEDGAYVAGWVWVSSLCWRCGAQVGPDGLCADPGCPYSQWPQNVDETDIENMTDEQIRAKYRLDEAKQPA